MIKKTSGPKSGPMSKRKEYFNLFNTLSCIPNILIKKNVLIFMRNDTWVAGTVQDADG